MTSWYGVCHDFLQRSVQWDPHKRTFENHSVYSRQLLVRVINDFLIRSVSRFSTKICSKRYNPHKHTFETHWVCSRQLLVRVVNDLLTRSVSRFFTKHQYDKVQSSQAHFWKPPTAFIHWQENLLQTHPSQMQRDNHSVERMSDLQTNATSIRLFGTPQLSPLYFLHISRQSCYSAAGGSCIKQARRKRS